MHLFVDNLTNVDFSYLDPKRGLVGETWLASIVLEGVLDEQGMVCDFGVVKKTLRNWLDQHIDHCLLIPSESHSVICEHNSSEISVNLNYYKNGNDYSIVCKSPIQAFTLIDTQSINPTSVANWCIKQLQKLLPSTIDKIQLNFTPENIEHHFYHYSHGLKKHDGNCQRIAHGHRSTVEIYRNEERDLALEEQWCEKWKDIYIGTLEDLKEELKLKGVTNNLFNYQSQQGFFELSIPAEHCYLISTESTVEFIAQHIVNTLKQQFPKDSIKVRAFEGIGKGAIAYST